MDENFELNKVEQKLFDIASQKRVPIYGGFELTPYCNLSCKMCYVKETAPGLPVLGADTWLDFARQAADMGTLVTQLTGGEPMVHPEFKKIYSGFKKLGMVVTMNTNGTQIDERMADFLTEDMPRRMNVSLYGPSREVYEQLCGNGKAFDQTIRGIELMKQRNIPVKINLTPTTINFPYIDDILDICRQYELPVEMTPYMFEPIRRSCTERQGYRLSPDEMAIAVEKWDRYRYNEHEMIARYILAAQNLERFEESRKIEGFTPLRCRAATSSFWLCWNGKMNACANMTKPQADVRELGFAAAWEEVKRYGATIRVPVRCMSCSLRLFCLTCAAIGLHENGTFEQTPQIMCDATEALARNLAKNVTRVERRNTEERSHEDEKES